MKPYILWLAQRLLLWNFGRLTNTIDNYFFFSILINDTIWLIEYPESYNCSKKA